MLSNFLLFVVNLYGKLLSNNLDFETYSYKIDKSPYVNHVLFFTTNEGGGECEIKRRLECKRRKRVYVRFAEDGLIAQENPPTKEVAALAILLQSTQSWALRTHKYAAILTHKNNDILIIESINSYETLKYDSVFSYSTNIVMVLHRRKLAMSTFDEYKCNWVVK